MFWLLPLLHAEPGPAEKAEEAAMKFASTLKARVVEMMGKEGPPGTISVCADEAPEVKARIEAESGVKLGRASLRLRNPANAAPPVVAGWLAALGERKADGLKGSVVQTPGKITVIKPIVVEAPCLNCHGGALAPATQAALSAKYPEDRATGYAVGDLRGALWAEVAVP